jgi:hypothetical protein
MVEIFINKTIVDFEANFPGRIGQFSFKGVAAEASLQDAVYDVRRFIPCPPFAHSS